MMRDTSEIETLVPCPRCVGVDDEDIVNHDPPPVDEPECLVCGDVRLVTRNTRRLWIEAQP